jgi:predicted permease
MDDIRYVLHALIRSRAFSAAVVVALGLGIGANAAMFGIIDRLLLRGPEHVAAPRNLFRLYSTTADVHGQQGTFPQFGYVTYALLRDQASSLSGVAAYSSASYVIGRGDDAESVKGYRVTHDFFSVLGARPALGRFFTPEEDLPPTGQNVLVLDYGLWQRRFGGDPGVIGSTVMLTGAPFTVVGVAPPDFTGVHLTHADIWVPMALSRTRPDWPTTWQAQWLRIVARAKRGFSVEQANAEAQALFRRNYGGQDPAAAIATLSFRPIAFNDSGREPPEYAVSRWLIGVSAIVLLIACANVANLMLARATRRRREVAVRLALGIGRWRLARLLALEGLALALVGCAIGLVLAHWSGLAIRVLLPEVAWTSGPVNVRVFTLAIALAALSGTLVGLAPLLVARRLDLNAELKSGSQQAGMSRSAARSALVFAQAALAIMLLVGAGLFVRSVRRVTSIDHGFEPHRVLIASMGWAPTPGTPEQMEAETARRRTVFSTVTQRLRAIPGVENAAVAVGTPFGNAFGVSMWAPGRDSIPKLEGGGPYLSAVEHGYFETTGMRLRQGRLLTAPDNATSERVVVINETMARVIWPGENPLSKCLQIFRRDLQCARVVGVVADVRRSALNEASAMQYWVPFGQERGIGGSTIVVRPSGDPETFIPVLRRLILEVEPRLLSTRIQTLQDAIDLLTRSWRLGATLFTIFGTLALVIAALGLYSVVAYVVAQQTQEFGVRMALGAQVSDIVRLVLRHAFVSVALGLAAGLAVALFAARYVEPLLFQTSPRDVTVFSMATLTLLGAAALACSLPAIRAARVDPAGALRME